MIEGYNLTTYLIGGIVLVLALGIILVTYLRKPDKTNKKIRKDEVRK